MEHFDGDEDEALKDYSTLQAESEKIKADSEIAKRKLKLMDASTDLVEEANAIWKRSSTS